MVALLRILPLVLLLLTFASWGEETAPVVPADQVPDTTEVTQLFNQGWTAYESSDYDLALQFSEQFIKQAPDDYRGYWLRGESRVRKSKDYEGAIEDLEQVNRLTPDVSSAWGIRGWYLILLGRFGEARIPCEKARELDPTSHAWTVNLGHTYLLQGNRETSYEWYRVTLPLIPDEAALIGGPLADFDLFIKRDWAVGASNEARAWFAQTWADWQDVEALNQQVAALYREGRYQEAIPIAQEAVRGTRSILGDKHSELATRLNNLAFLLNKTGRYDEAEPLYRDALKLRRQALPAGHPDIARSLNNLAALLDDTGRYDEAEPLYRDALKLRRQALPAGHPDIALSLNNLALLLNITGRYGEAEPLYHEALDLRRQALPAGHPDIATSLNNMAFLLNTTGRHKEAEPLYREALALYRKALPAGHPDIATSLNNLASLLNSTGRHKEAEPLYRDALKLRRQALPAGHPDIATSLNNLASLLNSTGRHKEAEPLYRDALKLRRQALPAGHPDIAGSLNNLAALLDDTGRYDEAEPLYREALKLRRQALPAGHPDIALSLNNLASLLNITGRYGEAEPLYHEALDLRRQALPAGHPDIATSLNNMAFLLNTTGRHKEAEPLYREALKLSRKALPAGHPDIAGSLNNLAALLDDTGRYDEAEPLYREALDLRRQALPAGHPDIALSLNNLASLLNTTGRHKEAEPLYREALKLRRQALPAGHPDIAGSLNNLAFLLNTTGRHKEAEPLYRDALAIADQGDEPEALWIIQGNFSAFHANQGRLELAIFFGKQAVNTLQSVRQNLQSSERATQLAFLKSKEFYYKNLADLLIGEGRLPEAQQVLTMLKEEEYFDFVRRDAEDDARTTQASYTGIETLLDDGYQQLSGRLTALGHELGILEEQARFGLSEAEEVRRSELQAELDAAAEAFEDFLDRLLTAFDQVTLARAKEIGEKRLEDTIGLQETLRELGDGTVLVHYLMTDEQLHILLTTPHVQLARQATISENSLNHYIHELRTALQNPRSDPLKLAQGLYQYLIAPIAEDLIGAKARTLLVSLDGALRYVPLAVLHDGQRYLAEHFRTVVFTAAAQDKLTKPPHHEARVAGLGLTQAHPGFSALPSVAMELEGIVQREDVADSDGVVPGEILLDEAFTPEGFQHILDRRYPLLHIASHFSFNPGTVEDSFLLLGDGSKLTLNQLKSVRYRFRDVDLLTLSACNTAMGQNAEGKEVESFGVLAQRRGARGVMATLWPVADQSTGLFMQHFYHLLVEDQRIDKAEVLRRVQLAFVNGEAGAVLVSTGGERSAGCLACDTDEVDAPPTATDYRHPYYWAPFILMGNWL